MAMPIFERTEGKRKRSAIFFYDAFLYIKSNADFFTKLTCHRWRDGCEGTVFIGNNHFYSNIKYQKEPEMFEVTKS